jgi:lipopolysaccharide assembly outer membrane protein LptD (OstA)
MGNVRIVDRQDVVEADFSAIDLRSLVALASNASLDTPSPGVSIEGESIRRTGVNTYQVENGQFTTCRCVPDTQRRPWEIEVEKADVRVGGYAVARNLWFKVWDVPLLYAPWVIFPVKTERQTGFLLPSVAGSGRNGTEIETPFFVTLGEQAGAVLRPTYMSSRGLKGALEVEYLLGESTSGEIGVAGLPGDDEVDRDELETPFSDNRWAWWVRHEQPLAPGARFGLDLKRVSDNQYPIDFDDIDDVRNERFIESSGWASFARQGWYAGIEASLVDDLQSPNDLDRDDYLLQRLPDVRLASVPRGLFGLPLRFGLDTRYTYFHQIDGTDDISVGGVVRRPTNGLFYDTGADALFDGQEPTASGSTPLIDVHRDNFDPARPDSRGRGEGDGLFQEGELLADRGHRVDLYPRLSLPVRLGVLESLSEVAFRETLYFPEEGEDERREIWTMRFDLRTRLARLYRFAGQEVRHTMEPRAVFAVVSAANQERNPLFIPNASLEPRRLSEGDLRVITRDPTDRVEEARLLQLQLGNRVFARPATSLAPRMLAEVRLGAGYDFLESELDRIFAEARAWPLRQIQASFELGWDAAEKELDDAGAAIQWEAAAGHRILLQYRYRRQLANGFEEFNRDDDIFDEADADVTKVTQLNLNSLFVVSSRLQLFANGYLSLEDSSTNGGEFGFLLESSCRCWDLIGAIEHRTRPSDTRFNLELRLSGLGRRSRVPGHPERSREMFRNANF